MSEITFYYCPQTRCRTVLWMLEEVGADYETKQINVRDDIQSEAYAQINPMRKVPALMIDGELITETAAICLYLADVFPDAGLAPKIGEAGRASYLRWMFFGSAVVEPAYFDKASGRAAPAGSVGWGEADRAFATLQAGLKDKDYLVNDRFSAADVALGSTLGFLMHFKMIDSDPVFGAYVERIMDRPAAKKAFKIDAERAEALYGG